MVKLHWVWRAQNQLLRLLRCFAFVTLRVFQWFLREEILVLLGQEFLVNLAA
jgi:hypothetical protein